MGTVKNNAASEDTRKSEKNYFTVEGITTTKGRKGYEVNLSCFNYLLGKKVSFSVGITELTPQKVHDLIKLNGGICRSDNETYRALEDMIDDVLITINNNNVAGKSNEGLVNHKHDNMGWNEYNGKIAFYSDAIYQQANEIRSEYVGQYLVERKGALAELKSMLKECVFGHTPLEGSLAIGASATALGYANSEWGLNLYNPIAHLVGNSSSGKSTACKLIASFVGCPNGADGFFKSFIATPNALVEMIGNNQGVPLVIDEFSSSSSKKEWTDFVYTLSNGFSKARCRAGGNGVRKVRRFTSVFATNGETSILSRCNQNDGIRARLFEFNDVEWTRNALEADTIKAVVSENYGILSNMVAQELMKNSKKWKACYDKWLGKTNERIVTEKIVITVGDRIANYVALFMMSYEVIMKVLGAKCDDVVMFDFFFNNIIWNIANDLNIGDRAYHVIADFIAKNKGGFSLVEPGWNDLTRLGVGDIGFKVKAKKKHEVNGDMYEYYYVFPEETMISLLEDKGFSNPKLALKELHKAKLLKTKDSNRETMVFPINEVACNVYGVWFKDYEDFFSEDEVDNMN